MIARGLLAPLLLQGGMANADRPLTMAAVETAGGVAIVVRATEGRREAVSYVLSVTGSSTTRHAGRTSIGPGARTLSTVAVPANRPWTAVLRVTSPGGSYELNLSGGQPP